MKHAAAALFAAFVTIATANGQTTSGSVHYLETISLDLKLDGEAAPFAAMLPKEHRNEHLLYFNPEASIFQSAPPKKGADEPAAGQQGIQIRMQPPQEKYYTNLKDGQQVALQDFMGRKFLVSGARMKQSWKMTGRQKTILKYPCQEAVLYRTDDTVTAWFTSSIPVSTGPRGLSGLPGLILESSEGRHQRMIATSVEPGAAPAQPIAAPKGGKKVTREEFTAIVDEKMRELGGSHSTGGAKVIIKAQHY